MLMIYYHNLLPNYFQLILFHLLRLLLFLHKMQNKYHHFVLLQTMKV